MRICVVGGGYSGLAAARTLARSGVAVTLLEQSQKEGGLAQCISVAGTDLDIYYRHIFQTDYEIQKWISEYQLPLDWCDSRMAYFSMGRLFSFGKPQDLLLFSPLSWYARVRFALGVLLMKARRDPKPLEKETAKEYILRIFGVEVFNVVWKPLLVSKFGDDFDKVGAVWFWGKIALRSRSRNASGIKEQLGYMPGSFSKLTAAITKDLASLGVCCVSGVKSTSIVKENSGKFSISFAQKDGSIGCEKFDRVISAVPLPELLKICTEFSEEERKRLQKIRFTAASILVLRLKKQFSSYYWVNIGDRTLPFGGLIEHTNLVSPSLYGGSHILYISHYLSPLDPWYALSKNELLSSYLPYLLKVNPAFSVDDILESWNFKADYAQPVVLPEYEGMKPTYETSVSGLFHVGMAHIYPEDRGMNYALKSGRECAEALLAEML